MQDAIKARWSIGLSIVAVAVSGVTLYNNVLRPVQLEMAVSQDAFVSNEIRGEPDIILTVAFFAEGPSGKSLTIADVEAVLTRTQTGQQHRVNPNAARGEFPLVLEGGTTNTLRTLLQVDDYVRDEIDRSDTWSNDLRAVFPEKAALVDTIRASLKESLLHHDDPLATLELREVRDRVAELLADAPVEGSNRILFFTSGPYDVSVSAVDPFGEVLAEATFTLDIDEVLSSALRRGFGQNHRVRMSSEGT